MSKKLTGMVSDWTRFRAGSSGLTLMSAHFTEHRFERHSHETYSIGLTAVGVQMFHCQGSLHASLPGDLMLFNPDQDHDGQRGTDEGFGYSMLYVPTEIILSCSDKEIGMNVPRYFLRPHVRDPGLAHVFGKVVGAMENPGESLRTEELMRIFLSCLLLKHGEKPKAVVSGRTDKSIRLQRVREYLHEYYYRDVTVSELAAVACLSRAHLTRAFSRHFGVPPHIYLNGVRIRRAKGLMLRGRPLAEVAAECGFVDQSHFSRRFKGSIGTTPSEWLAQLG